MKLSKLEKEIVLEACQYYYFDTTQEDGETVGLKGMKKKLMQSAIKKLRVN